MNSSTSISTRKDPTIQPSPPPPSEKPTASIKIKRVAENTALAKYQVVSISQRKITLIDPLTKDLSETDAQIITSAVALIPPNVRDSTLKHVKELLTYAPTAIERLFLIDFYKGNQGFTTDTHDAVKQLLRLKIILYQHHFAPSIQAIHRLQSLDTRERKVLINQLLPLFQTVESSSHNLLDKILDIPRKKREIVLSVAKDALPKSDNGEILWELLSLIVEANDTRADVIHAMTLAKPLIEACKRDELSIFKAIYAIPKHERQKSILFAAPLIKQTQNGVLIGYILKAIASCDPDKRADLRDAIEQSMPYMPHNDYSKIVEAVFSIPQNIRKEVLEHAKPYIIDNYFFDAAVIITNVAKIQPSDWQDVWTKALPYIEAFETNNEKTAFLSFISAIEPVKRKEFLTTIAPYLKETTEIEVVEQIFVTISKRDLNEWHAIELLAESFIKAKDSFTIRWAILLEISDIPKEKRGKTLSRATPALQALENRELISKYIGAFASMSHDEWNAIEQVSAPYLKQVSKKELESVRIHLYLRLFKQKPSERAALLAKIAEIEPHFTFMMELLREITEHFHINERLSLLTYIAKVVKSSSNIDLVVTLMKKLSEIAPGSREPLFMSIENELETAATEEEREAIFYDGISELEEYLGYSITVSRTEIEDNPIAILERLIHLIDTTEPVKNHLYVRFTGEDQAIDHSGVSKEFITLLFDSLTRALHFEKQPNGLFLPKGPMTEQEKCAYQHLGKFILFLLNAKYYYPIGKIFDLGFFAALTMLKSPHLHRPFEKLVQDPKRFQELVALYAAMKGSDSSMLRLQTYAKPYIRKTDPAIVQEAFAFASLEYDELFEKLGITQDTVQNHRRDVQKAVQEFITDCHLIPNLKPYLLPCIEVVRGMHEDTVHNKSWLNLEPDELSDKVQGQITKDLVLSNLVFDNVAEEKQRWVREWILEANDDSLKTFVFAMTGSTTIPSTTSYLTIKAANHISYSTCFNKAAFPFAHIEDQETFKQRLNESLINIQQYNTE